LQQKNESEGRESRERNESFTREEESEMKAGAGAALLK
jgi:hypothetical protein